MFDHLLIATMHHAMRHSLIGYRNSLAVPKREWVDFVKWQVNSCSLPQEFEVYLEEDYAKYFPTLEVKRLHSRASGKEPTVVQEIIDPYEVVLGYGAGIDSTIAAFWALKKYGVRRMAMVQVNYGAPYTYKENKAFNSLRDTFLAAGIDCYRTRFIHMSGTRSSKEGWITPNMMGLGYIIPMRNALISSIAAGFGKEVWIVANYRKIDDGPNAATDKNRRFYAEMSGLCSGKGYRRVTSPFLHISKAKSIEWFLQNYPQDFVLEVLDETTTCYHPTEHRCGKCFACMKLMMSLETCGLGEHFHFSSPPAESPDFTDYLKREAGKGRPIPEIWQALLNGPKTKAT